MSTWSQYLLIAAVVVLVAGYVVPGWDTAQLPKRAVKRRIYWTATLIGVVLLFLGGQPVLQNSVAFVGAGLILMVGWAYFRTPNIKIGGQIFAAYPPDREPDPPHPSDRSQS